MAYEIIRKKRFLNKLTQVLAFLEKEWDRNVAIDFLDNIDSKVDTLRQNPYIGASSGIRNTRSLHVTGHNRIFYKVVKNKVVIINLYDTRKKTYRSPQWFLQPLFYKPYLFPGQ